MRAGAADLSGAAAGAGVSAGTATSPLLAAVIVLAVLVIAATLFALRQRRMAVWARRKLLASSRASAADTGPAGAAALSWRGRGGAAGRRPPGRPLHAGVGELVSAAASVEVTGSAAEPAARINPILAVRGVERAAVARASFAPLAPGARGAATAAEAVVAADVEEAAAADAADEAAPASRWIECRGDGSTWYVSEADATVSVWAVPPGGVVVGAYSE